jgi:hypothetical protein
MKECEYRSSEEPSAREIFGFDPCMKTGDGTLCHLRVLNRKPDVRCDHNGDGCPVAEELGDTALERAQKNIDILFK